MTPSDFFQRIGFIIVGLYYFMIPSELFKINIGHILFHLSLIYVIALFSARFFSMPKITKTENPFFQAISIYQGIPHNLFKYILVIGEDFIFIINFFPEYKTNLLLKFVTSLIFGFAHYYSKYPFETCLVKTISHFAILNFHQNFINLNLSHLIMDYLVFLAVQDSCKKAVQKIKQDPLLEKQFVEYIMSQ